MTQPRHSLSVIVQAYGEADNILPTLENILAALDGLPLDAEVLVIDNGSTDGTADRVRERAPTLPGVRLLVKRSTISGRSRDSRRTRRPTTWRS